MVRLHYEKNGKTFWGIKHIKSDLNFKRFKLPDLNFKRSLCLKKRWWGCGKGQLGGYCNNPHEWWICLGPGWLWQEQQ